MFVLQALLVTLAVNPPVPVVPRTPPPGATPAAQVVVLQGAVSGVAGKAEFKLARGVLLDGSDKVNVPPGAWVALVLLGNGQVVRLDDDVSLVVEKLALFKAPAATEDSEALLNRLLTKKERQGFGSERLIGWHQGQVAANTRAAEAASSKEYEKAPRRVASEEAAPLGGEAAPARQALNVAPRPPGAPPPAAQPGPARAANAPMPVPPAAPPPPAEPPAPPPPPPSPPAPAKQATAEKRSKRDASGGGAQRGRAMDMDLLERETRSERKSTSDDLEADEAKANVAPARAVLAVDAALSSCVAHAVSNAGAEVRQALGARVTLRFRLRDDEVQVGTGGALPVEACLVGWATAHRAQLGPAWATVVVPLK